MVLFDERRSMGALMFACLTLVLMFSSNGSYDATAESLTDCIRDLFKNTYRGSVSETNHGFTCQAWNTQYPHKHWYTEDIYFPDDGGVTGASNFCRQSPGPTSEATGRPWCYTVHPHIVMEFCDLRICNGTKSDSLIHLKASQGVITSPDANDDGLYDLNVDILWIIEASDGEIIRFNVIFALIRLSDYCEPDGLKIFEADALVDVIVICGEHLFQDYYNLGETVSNLMYVQFYSDYQSSAAGFEITYEHRQAPNQSHYIIHMNQSNGWIAAPDRDLDGLYDLNVLYEWVVETNNNTVVRYQVLYVQIQYTAGCNTDYLWIAEKYMLLTKLCGFGGIRPPMETRTNELYVEFRSSNYLTSDGFNMTFAAIQKSVDVCGESLFGGSGLIVSPDKDGNGYYDNNLYCTWHIQVAEQHVIRYTFHFFEVLPSNDCVKDRLLISERDDQLYSYCGFLNLYCGSCTETPEGETLGDTLFLEFYSYEMKFPGYKGFEIGFYERNKSAETCGGMIINSTVYIIPPDYDTDGYYDFNLNCFWNIKVAANSTILFHIIDMEVEETTDCVTADYVRIMEIINRWTCRLCPVSELVPVGDERLVFTKDICGSYTDLRQQSMTNDVLVNFVSDGRFSYRGFIMTFDAIEIIRREENISNGSGAILQPRFTHDFENVRHLSCEWTIWPNMNMSIRFEVVYVNILPRSPECRDYHLQTAFVILGIFISSKYCNKQVSGPPYQVRDSWVFLRFFVPLYVTLTNEFLVNYEYVPEMHIYGEDVSESGPSGSITSTFLENGLYDYNVYVKWEIIADIGKLLSLNFLYIDVERTFACFSDFIAVQTDNLDAYILCGVTTKHMLTSHDNVAKIKFSTDCSINKSGFNMTYNAISGAANSQANQITDLPFNGSTLKSTDCEAVLTGSTDIISSPHLGDGQYGSNLTCLWKIHLEDDFVIVFHVKEMDIQETDQCFSDYLQVREDHRSIGKFCGSKLPTPLTTEANMLYVLFITDSFLSGKGFKAIYYQAQDMESCSQNYHCLLSNVKIESSSLCDFYVDCPNKDDERFCEFRCPWGCDCLGLAVDCSGKHKCHQSEDHIWNITNFISIPSVTRKLDISTNPHVFQLMKLGKQNLSHLTYLNVSQCGISEFDNDIFRSMVKLKILDISYNKLRRLASDVFSPLSKLEKLVLIGNSDPITFELRAFAGLSGLHLELVDLHIERIVEYAFATLNVTELKIFDSEIGTIEDNAFGELLSKAIYLNTSKLNYFKEGMFDGVQNLETLKTDDFKFCCVRPITVREENCLPGKGDFSSCEDLISIEILRPFAWVISLLTIISNVSSVGFRVAIQREQLKRTSGFFVTNLAVSDCLMGFYLLIVAIADTYYRNVYIFHDEEWRHSLLCKLAGILSATSNESSLLFVALITLDRIIFTKYPFGEVRLTIKHARRLSVLVWGISLFLSVLPVVVDPVFEGRFYSLSGVCLALPITRARLPGHAYSVGIFVGLNSVMCALIAYGQWYIYKELKNSSMSLSENRSITNKDAKVARRLLTVAIIDLLCWFPVFVLGILALLNCAIEGVVFSWIAVVVIPINAAANPVIYTLLSVWQARKSRTQKELEGKVNGNAIMTKETLALDNAGKLLDVWLHYAYWQAPGQLKGYKLLTEWYHGTNCITSDHRLQVAKSIARLIQILHARNMIQSAFKEEDVYVKVHDGSLEASFRTEQLLVVKLQETKDGDCCQSVTNVAMVLRPKYTQKREDYQHNVSSLGSLLGKLLTQNKEQNAPFDPLMPTPSTSAG